MQWFQPKYSLNALINVTCFAVKAWHVIYIMSFHRVGSTFPLSLNWWRSQWLTALITRAVASVSSPGIPTAAGTGSSVPKSGRQTSRALVCGCSTSLVWKCNHSKYILQLWTVFCSAWQQDVDGADTSAICSRAALSQRFAKPPPTSEWTQLLCSVKPFVSCHGYYDSREIPLRHFHFICESVPGGRTVCLLHCFLRLSLSIQLKGTRGQHIWIL